MQMRQEPTARWAGERAPLVRLRKHEERPCEDEVLRLPEAPQYGQAGTFLLIRLKHALYTVSATNRLAT